VVQSSGETEYRALFIEAKRRFANNFQFNLSYTLAKADNFSGAGDGGGSGSESPFDGSRLLDQFNPELNNSPAPTDQRHRLVLSGIFNLPKFRGGNSFVRGIVNGYRLSGIYTAESGRPYTATVNFANNNNRFIVTNPDGSQIRYEGFGGSLGQGGINVAPGTERNEFYGEANYRFDLRLARDFKITERATLELIAESFNLFNTTNFNGFNSTLYQAVFPTGTNANSPPDVAVPIPLTVFQDALGPTFARPTNNSSQPDGTNARRFQLAARFRF
jgi:hypothetical protein